MSTLFISFERRIKVKETLIATHQSEVFIIFRLGLLFLFSATCNTGEVIPKVFFLKNMKMWKCQFIHIKPLRILQDLIFATH